MLSEEQLIDIVGADLLFLREEWEASIDDHSLRRSSTVLRRLLVENELQRAWKKAGFPNEPRIRASTLTPLLTAVPLPRIRFATAGGATFKGVQIRGLMAVNYAMTESEIKALRAQGVPEEEFGLRRFIEAPCMVVEGAAIPRRVLIKFVSNKLGGAHFDSRRGDSAEDQNFRRLDLIGKTLAVADKNSVYYELLSTGQFLVRAPDIMAFCEKAAALKESSSEPR